MAATSGPIGRPIARRAELKDAEQLAVLAERTFRATFGPCNAGENMDAHCAGAYGVTIKAFEIVNPEIETFVCDDRAGLVGSFEGMSLWYAV